MICTLMVGRLSPHLDILVSKLMNFLTWHQHAANFLQRVYSCLYHLYPSPPAL